VYQNAVSLPVPAVSYSPWLTSTARSAYHSIRHTWERVRSRSDDRGTGQSQHYWASGQSAPFLKGEPGAQKNVIGALSCPTEIVTISEFGQAGWVGVHNIESNPRYS